MSLCERNIDCLECLSRGMCNSYAKFQYNQALEDVMKIYNEMQPKLATNVYEFGERIKALKK